MFTGVEMIIPWNSLPGPRINCYSIEEIFFSEMLRALVEISAAYNEDKKQYRLEKIAQLIYDIVRFRSCYGGYLDFKKLKLVIKQKFEHKSLSFPAVLREMTLPSEIPLDVWEKLSKRVIYTARNLKEMDRRQNEDWKKECINEDMCRYLKNASL